MLRLGLPSLLASWPWQLLLLLQISRDWGSCRLVGHCSMICRETVCLSVVLSTMDCMCTQPSMLAYTMPHTYWPMPGSCREHVQQFSMALGFQGIHVIPKLDGQSNIRQDEQQALAVM